MDIYPNMIKSTFIEDLQLNDNVLVVNVNGEWIVIPLLVLMKIPMMHFYTEHFVGTLILCLITLQSMFLYDKVDSYYYDETGYNIHLKLSSNKLLSFNNTMGDDIKRSQCKIQTLRSALIEYGDVKFLHIDTGNKKYVINPNYYTNLLTTNDDNIPELQFHPKTLYTLIYYESGDAIKTTLVIGKGANPFMVSGYEPKKEMIDNYIATSSEKLIEKKAFITNILAYTAKILYPSARVIVL